MKNPPKENNNWKKKSETMPLRKIAQWTDSHYKKPQMDVNFEWCSRKPFCACLHVKCSILILKLEIKQHQLCWQSRGLNIWIFGFVLFRRWPVFWVRLPDFFNHSNNFVHVGSHVWHLCHTGHANLQHLYHFFFNVLEPHQLDIKNLSCPFFSNNRLNPPREINHIITRWWLEWSFPSQHLKEKDTKTIHVWFMTVLTGFNHLRSTVACTPRWCGRDIHKRGQSKIRDASIKILVDEDIWGFNISMSEFWTTHRMNVGNAPCCPKQYLYSCLPVQWSSTSSPISCHQVKIGCRIIQTWLLMSKWIALSCRYSRLSYDRWIFKHFFLTRIIKKCKLNVHFSYGYNAEQFFTYRPTVLVNVNSPARKAARLLKPRYIVIEPPLICFNLRWTCFVSPVYIPRVQFVFQNHTHQHRSNKSIMSSNQVIWTIKAWYLRGYPT